MKKVEGSGVFYTGINGDKKELGLIVYLAAPKKLWNLVVDSKNEAEKAYYAELHEFVCASLYGKIEKKY
jgi:hypothetical protein